MKEKILYVQRIGLVGILNIFIGLGSLILLPILTKNFTITEYGIWVQVNVTIMLVPNIATLGLPYGMIRYLAGIKDKNLIRDFFYSILLIVLLTSVITSILFFIYSKEISIILLSGYNLIGVILPFIILFSCLNLLFFNYFLAFQKTKLYSTFLFIQNFLTIVLVAIITFYNLSIVYAIISILISFIITSFIMFLYIIIDIGFNIPKFTHLSEYLSFSLPLIPSNLSEWLINSSDRYVVNYFFGASAVGYYNAGYSIGNIVKMLFTPFAAILTPELSKNSNLNQNEKVKVFLKYSTKYYLLICIPAVFGISLLSKDLLTLFSTTEIAEKSYLVIPIIAITSLIYGLVGFVNQIMFIEKKNKITSFIIMISAIINLALTFILVFYMGFIGAAIATLISYFICLILMLYYSYNFFKFDFDKKFIVKCIFASIIMSMFIVNVDSSNWKYITFKVVISTLIYFGLLFLIKGLGKKEIRFLRNLIG